MAEKADYLHERKEWTVFQNQELLVLGLVAFLLGRAEILNQLTPFGIGFFTAAALRPRYALVTGVAVFLGIMTIQGPVASLPYGLALCVLAFVFHYMINPRKIKTLTAACLGAGIYLGAGTLGALMTRWYWYDLMMVVFEALVVLVTVYIAAYSLPILQGQQARRVLSTEEIVCLTMLMAFILSGVEDIHLGFFSLKNVLSILVTILFAYQGGVGVGAAIGITLGLIISMSTPAIPPTLIGIFAFSGLLSGVFKDLGKLGSPFGFLVGTSILTFYTNGYQEILIHWQEVLVASLLFFLIPRKWMKALEKYTQPALGMLHATRHYGDEIQARTQEKLVDLADTFHDLAASLDNMTRQVEYFGLEDLSLMLDKVALEICHDCGMRRVCWESNFLHTYQGFQDLLVLIETKAQLETHQLPEQIRKRCIRPEAVAEKMIYLYSMNRMNLLWKKRLLESKELAGRQLKGAAEGIQRLASELKQEIIFDRELEEALYVNLDKAGLPVKRLVVTSGRQDSLEIQVEKSGSCQGYQSQTCAEPYIQVISETVGKPLVPRRQPCNHQQPCRFTLIEAQKYRALTRAAQAMKAENRLSGDAFSFMEMGREGMLIVLSDGMGTGEKAHRQSSAAVTMLEKLMEAGFGKELSVQTLNSMMMLKSTEEVFATVDLALLDLHRGRVQFVKIGSAASYIKRAKGQVEVIHPASLPIGIISEIEVQERTVDLDDGDFIIMISDGIEEVQQEPGESWLQTYLTTLQTRNPQEMADKILHQALSYVDSRPQDDMTVLVTKVWQPRTH